MNGRESPPTVGDRDVALGIPDWEGDVVLADGATVHMRALHADDEPLLARMYEGMSDDSVYLRFFSPLQRPTATWLEMKSVGEPGHVSRVALLGGEVVAAARYDVVGDGVAEVAFIVADAHQGRGVGTLLLEHLAVIARSQGIHTFEADTLPGNSNMLGMFRGGGLAARLPVHGRHSAHALLDRAERGVAGGDR